MWCNAIREQNVQVAAGGSGPAAGEAIRLASNCRSTPRAGSSTEEEFGNIIVKTGPNGEKTLLKDVARLELGASGYSLRSLLNNKAAVAFPIFQSPGANALRAFEERPRHDGRTEKGLSRGRRLLGGLRPDRVRAALHQRRGGDAVRSDLAGRHRRHSVSANLARVDHSAGGGAGFARRHVRGDAGARVQHQYAHALRTGAGHRHRGR